MSNTRKHASGGGLFRNRKFGILNQKKSVLSVKKFCLFVFFGVFATQLIYLGELSQIKYTTKRNNSIYYNQYIDEYLHGTNKTALFQKRTQVINGAYYNQKIKENILNKKYNSDVQKVLLLTSNPRSGSSYVGEILTSMPNVSYFFEPLWLTSQNNKFKDLFNERMVLVGHILDCHYYKFKKILANNKARQFVFKKPHIGTTNFKTLPLIEKNKFLRSIRQNCSKNSVRVAKLFRLRMVDAISELRNISSHLGPDFKIILLQRDPRATINSLRTEPQEWLSGAAAPTKICGNLLQDFTAVQENKDLSERILSLRYEDVLSNPMGVTRKMFEFINATQYLEFAFKYIENHIEPPKKVQEVAQNITSKALQMIFIKRQMRLDTKWRNGYISRREYEKALNDSSYKPKNPDQENDKRLQKYYGTYRTKDFQHDHWRKELKSEILTDIMNTPECQKVLNLLSYE